MEGVCTRVCVGEKGIKNYKDCVHMTSPWLDVGNLYAGCAGLQLGTHYTGVPCRVVLGVPNLLSLDSWESTCVLLRFLAVTPGALVPHRLAL